MARAAKELVERIDAVAKEHIAEVARCLEVLMGIISSILENQKADDIPISLCKILLKMEASATTGIYRAIAKITSKHMSTVSLTERIKSKDIIQNLL